MILQTAKAHLVLACMSLALALGCGGGGEAGGEDSDLTSGTRYPILLVHGFNASPKSFAGIAPRLSVRGNVVRVATLPPFAGTGVRASYLRREIARVLAETGAKKVNIIAHSMGGLDSRVAIAREGAGDVVASVTTVATPHRGARAADDATFLRSDTLRNFALWIACDGTSDISCWDYDMPSALSSLSARESKDLNTRVQDDPRVFYQSFAAVSATPEQLADKSYPARVKEACEGKIYGDVPDQLSAPLRALQAKVQDTQPNDGLVTVESAKWGTFQGCVRADHNSVLGDPVKDVPNAAGYQATSLFVAIARDLAQRGF